VSADGAARAFDRMIFGGFLEHFDNQIYGGVFDPGSPLANAQGFRSDVIEALRELKTPIIRWPGGCFVDSYHWRNGVGPERTPHGDFRWGVIEPNTFGTHEFVALCRKIGAEPYICLNGLAEPRENLDWVAYCNATEGPMAELRKANGHPSPLDVKYWSVGNERYDRPYIHHVRDTVRAMKATYPGILISCSGAQDGTAIHPYLLEQAGACLDFVSIHSRESHARWLPSRHGSPCGFGGCLQRHRTPGPRRTASSRTAFPQQHHHPATALADHRDACRPTTGRPGKPLRSTNGLFEPN
jgi:alpha-N-arabinofuranosidase